MTIIRSLQDSRLPLRRTSVALGMFDGAHRGHQAVLGRAVERAAQDSLTPCVFSFALANPPHVKPGALQLTTPHMLAHILAGMGFTHAAAPSFAELRGLSAQAFVQSFLRDTLGAAFICCGYNFAFSKNRSATAADLRELAARAGIACEVVPEIDLGGAPVSSTRIRAAIGGGDMPLANELLGRLFAIDFAVVEGNRIGRTLGSPTINQPFPADFVIPRFGVYATIAFVDGAYHSGVTNVGVKPTVGSGAPLAETYIHGFCGDLYGKSVEVSFLEFIRPEQKFPSMEILRENILRDAETARAIGEKFIHALPKRA